MGLVQHVLCIVCMYMRIGGVCVLRVGMYSLVIRPAAAAAAWQNRFRRPSLSPAHVSTPRIHTHSGVRHTHLHINI